MRQALETDMSQRVAISAEIHDSSGIGEVSRKDCWRSAAGGGMLRVEIAAE